MCFKDENHWVLGKLEQKKNSPTVASIKLQNNLSREASEVLSLNKFKTEQLEMCLL